MTLVDEFIGKSVRMAHRPRGGGSGRWDDSRRIVDDDDAGVRVIHDEVVLLPYAVHGVHAAAERRRRENVICPQCERVVTSGQRQSRLESLAAGSTDAANEPGQIQIIRIRDRVVPGHQNKAAGGDVIIEVCENSSISMQTTVGTEAAVEPIGLVRTARAPDYRAVIAQNHGFERVIGALGESKGSTSHHIVVRDNGDVVAIRCKNRWNILAVGSGVGHEQDFTRISR